jgi:predicted kinase
MMVGLPRSGKSTLATQMGYPIVSADAIRRALGTYPFIPAAEPWVWQIARTMVESLFHAGHQNVILDSCSQTRKRRDEWVSKNWKRKFIVIDTPKEICIGRALATDQEYLIPTIERMAMQYEGVIDEETDD